MQKRRYYNITFHGSLAEQFGKEVKSLYALHLQDVMEGLTACCGQEFKNVILHGSWHIISGDVIGDEIPEDAKSIPKELVTFPIKDQNLHIFPSIQGAGRMGTGMEILLGVVLIASAVLTAGATSSLSIAGISGEMGLTVSSGVTSSLALAGAAAIVGGIMGLIVPVPKMNYGVAQRQSFIFSGVVNNTSQGNPVPLIYGEHMTGSTVISADIQTTNVNWNMLTAQQVSSGVLH